MDKLEQLKERILQDPEARREYDALEEEFALIDEQLRARGAAAEKEPDQKVN